MDSILEKGNVPFPQKTDRELLEEMQERCELIMTDKPYQVTSHITFLGTIPRKLEWEGKKNVGQLVVGDKLLPDYINDDSAAIYKD